MADYYVAIGGNNSDDGSAAHPWATIQKGADTAVAGDTVHVASGTYGAVVSDHDGTASQRITFISDVKWGAQLTVTNGTAAVWTNNGDYVTIQGFDITSNIQTNAGATMGINNNGSYCWIVGNLVHDMPCMNSWTGHPNEANGGGAICSGSFLSYSLDPNTSSAGNIIIGNITRNIGPTPAQQIVGSIHGIYTRDSFGFIHNNIVNNVSSYGIVTWHGATNNTITNNLTFCCISGGIVTGNNTGFLCDYNVVNNNISIYNPNATVPPYVSGIAEANNMGLHNVYYSNCCYQNMSGNINQYYGGETIVGTVTADAQFVNWQTNGTGDYHLKSISPCLGVGVPMGAPSIDFDGNPRPSRVGVYDIGPYQFQMNVNPVFSSMRSMYPQFMKRRM